MQTLFNNKYRIPSARLQHWNYANEAMYFVTICTKNRQHFFGDVSTESEKDSIILNPTEIGKIAHSEWYKTIELRLDMNIELGEFVVMPNHIHGIVMIGQNKYNTDNGRDALQCVSNNPVNNDGSDVINDGSDVINDGSDVINDGKRDALQCVSTNKNQFGPQSKNLPSIIRGYKTAVTTYARHNNINFDWQPRYYDHIIRNMDAYNKISEYIIANPVNWVNDKFYP